MMNYITCNWGIFLSHTQTQHTHAHTHTDTTHACTRTHANARAHTHTHAHTTHTCTHTYKHTHPHTHTHAHTHTHTHTDAQTLFLFCRLCQAEISKKMLNYNKVVTALLEVRIILSCTTINIIVCTDTEWNRRGQHRATRLAVFINNAIGWRRDHYWVQEPSE